MALFLLVSMLPLAGRVLALRQNQEEDLVLHEADPELLPTGKAGYFMLCCVSDKASFGVADSRFRGAAGRMLQAVAEDGAYGMGSDFHRHRFNKHCKAALRLDHCPDVEAPADDDARSDPDKLAAAIEEFLAKYGIHSEEKTPEYKTYMGHEARCPKDFHPQQDLLRCSSDMKHFLKLLELWLKKLQAEEEVKDNTGIRGFFLSNPKSRQKAYEKLRDADFDLVKLWFKHHKRDM
ncbi:unnamed protein product [Symbiodinium natans]|uniref:Uncharacterized protein n=1 Tax=Symbiodinium natans TaxID=878477 RepID=A0A812QES4_9DINO|nr:unnamed protein product [Symbiodinium natans]